MGFNCGRDLYFLIIMAQNCFFFLHKLATLTSLICAHIWPPPPFPEFRINWNSLEK